MDIKVFFAINKTYKNRLSCFCFGAIQLLSFNSFARLPDNTTFIYSGVEYIKNGQLIKKV